MASQITTSRWSCMQPQAKWLASLLQLTQGAVGSIFNCTQRPVKGVCLINSFLVSQKKQKNKKQEEKAQCHNAVRGGGGGGEITDGAERSRNHLKIVSINLNQNTLQLKSPLIAYIV